ncbi:hypothetical protein WN48_11255 [Eufriesea mexicana]|uniref:Uncharacterized protein n=1 Tax=Eufriesea mexicana TaxID=516756 RepID=A0A310S8F9_9HYME|nr:hypothetical protein WN48_11255 [Eufriesea mexicana]
MEEQNILTSKSYKRAEANLKNKLKLAFLKHHPHYLVPGYNLHSNFSVDDFDLENVVEQYQEYPYHCDLPKPLLPPAKLPRNGDPALELVTLKSHMNSDIDRMKHYYLKHKKELELIHKKDIKWNRTKHAFIAKVPKYIANLAQIIDKDPDPYFEGVYNWYYTGGSIDYVQLHNKDILLFPFMGELVSTPLDNVEEFFWKLQLRKAAKCELSGSLYELKHNISVDTCRYKQHCNFYVLSVHNSKCNLTEIHTQTSKIPYISADLNPINVNQYCLVNVERCVTLWDLTKMKPINYNTVMQTTVLDDPWSSITFQSIDPNILLFTDRCCLHYLDIRIPFNRPVLTMCPKLYLEKCEYLSLDIASRNNFCRYIGTYHSILMCDNRSPQQCVQQKWTHQLKSPPLMGHTIDRDDKEFVVLSSQIAGETTVIVNTWTTSEISHSYNFPYIPPHMKETLDQSQMQGMCLNPYLRDRSYCILNAWEKAISIQTDTVVPLTISSKLNMQHPFKTPELLAVWEICEEVPLPLIAAPHQKVLSWLESADAKVPISSQEEIDNVSTPINTQELISVSQELDMNYLDDSNALQDLLPKVKIVRSRKKENVRKRQKM